MAAHPNILSWEIPWTEKPGRLQSMASQESQTWPSGYTTIINTTVGPGVCDDA